ncbi:MAG: hypothetical protein M3R17_11680, partial [Bacteroidota bacterium]|nr:hypothetical protein [Bacteroidota bacterium]
MTLILAIGFGILSIFFPVMIPAAIYFGVKQFKNDLDRTQFEHAGANTSFDPNEALSTVVPSSYWWLVLDAAGIVLDGAQMLKFVQIGTKAARSVNMLRKLEKGVEELVVDASNMPKYIDNVTVLVKAQVGDVKLQETFIKYLTNEQTISKIRAEELSRQALLKNKSGVSLAVNADLLKSLTSDTEILKDFYRAAMLRANDIPYGNGKTLLRQIDEVFALGEPAIAKRLLRVVGESEAMAKSFGDLANAVGKSSGGVLSMDEFVRFEFSSLAGDNNLFFRNLADYNVTGSQMDEVVQKASKASSPNGANTLLHDGLMAIVDVNKKTMRVVAEQGVKKYSYGKVNTDVKQQIDDATQSASDLKAKTDTGPKTVVTDAKKPQQITEDFHAKQIEKYGDEAVKRADNALAADTTKADDLYAKYSPETAYDEVVQNGGDLNAADKSLGKDSFGEWYNKEINAETQLALKEDNIWVIYRNMDPRTRKLLTMCASVCVPTKITALQTSRVNKIINDFELTGNEMNLREFLH